MAVRNFLAPFAGIFILIISVVSAEANCLGPAAVPGADVSKFKGDPIAALNGKTGDELKSLISALAASDTSTLAGIMQAFAGAGNEDKVAIAKGLGKAASDCTLVPEDSNKILDTMVGQPDYIRTAFNDGAGQKLLAATGGGGAGGGSSGTGGGQTATLFGPNTNSGEAGGPQSSTTPSVGFTFFAAGSGGASARSVSP